MKIAHSIFSAFGEDITVNGKASKGFISPINAKKHDNIKKPTAVGVKNGAEYLLITESKMLPCGGDEILHGDRRYISLRSEAIYYGGNVSHYEAVLRKKGGGVNV